MSRDALIIGINHYKHLKQLDSPATDAEDIAQILKDQGGFTINRLPAREDIDKKNRSIVTVANSGEITLPELKNALVQLFNPTSQKPPEVALFYFSGHGLREDQGGIQQGFLATTHSETKSYNNCLPLDWLRKLLRNSPVRQQIVWLDCCYSGELFNFAEADPGQRDQGFNRCFIAASRDFEAAIAPQTSDHSLFTEALLKALDYSQSAHGYIDNYQLEENLKQILKTSSFPQQSVYDNSGERPIVLTGCMYATKPAFGENFCPFKGLRYFDNKSEDALFFKGRDKLIAELLTKVKTKPFLVILGASGNGKSSVVRAGVLYQLQQTGTCEIVNPFTPTATPLTALTNGLGTTDIVAVVNASTKARVILTIDQFEEVFSLCQDPQARDTFFNTLLDAVEQATGKFCLIVIMRADFMDKCSNYPRLAHYFQDHQHIVTRPTEAEIQQIIEAPAKQAGFLVEPRLMAEMVTDFKDSLGGLPLLEFALTTLWEKGKADRLLRYADYQALGGIQGILEKKATEIYEKTLTPAEQVVAKRVFLELTELGEGKPDTRRLVPQTDLLGLTTTQTSVEQVIAKLVKEHLIVTDKTAVTVVNIAHDALIEHWSVLRKWLDQSREDLKLQRQINEGAKAWQVGNKALLVGVDLVLAEEYLGTHLERVPLSEVGVEFVKESVVLRIREQRRERRNRWLAFATLGLVLLIVAGWLYREVESGKKLERSLVETEHQKNKALTTQSLSLAEFARQETEKRNFTIATLLALEALPNEENPDKPFVYEAPSALYGIILNQQDNTSLPIQTTGKISFSPNSNQLAIVNHKIVSLWNIPNNRVTQVLSGHSDEINSVAYSSDGKWLLTASSDKTARLWDSINGQPLFTLAGHTNKVNYAILSPNNKLVITTSEDKSARLWDSVTGKLIHELKGHDDSIVHAAFSFDNKLVATASYDNTVCLWDVSEGQLLFVLKEHELAVVHITFSPDNKLLMSVSSDKVILWNSKNGKKIYTLGNQESSFSHATFNPDGKQIAITSYDGEIQVRETDTGKLLRTLKGQSGGVNCANFSEDGKWLVSASNDKKAHLWNAESGKLISVLEGHEDEVYCAYFDSFSQKIATVSKDETIRLWNTNDENKPVIVLSGHQATVNHASFSHNGKLIATVSGVPNIIDSNTESITDNTVRLWDAQNGKSIHILTGHQSGINHVDFNYNDSLLVTASGDATAHLWQVRDGQLLYKLTGHSGGISHAIFSQDGKYVLTSSEDTTAKLWDTDNGKLLYTFIGHEGPIFQSDISSDNAHIVTASADKTARLWRINDGKLLFILEGHQEILNYVVFSPDAKKVVTASDDHTSRIWDVNTGKLLHILSGHRDSVNRAIFSANGELIITSSDDKTARVWDTMTGKLLNTLVGHEDMVTYANFSPNNQQAVTVSDDRTARIWDVKSGKTLAVLSGHQDLVHHAAFNPQDSTKVLTTSEDHTARLWKIFSVQELTNLTKKRVSRELTQEERKQFFLEY